MVSEPDHELYTVGVSCIDHFVALLQRDGHGFLDKNVLPGIERVDRESVV